MPNPTTFAGEPNIGGRIKLGGYVLFSDNQFQTDGVSIRIVGIKDFINNPHSPTIELSNEIVGSSIASDLRKIETNEVVVDDKTRSAVQFTKRRFRDSQETISMLEDALLDKFTNSINPITVQTMAMLVGDESLQFRFVNNMDNPEEVPHNVKYYNETKILTVPGGILQHLTLGITTLSSKNAVREYKFWTIPAYNFAPLTDGEKKYYLYAKVSETNDTNEFILSETAKAMEEEAGYYYLLMGVLNSEYEGERSYVSLYGFTEILPGRITTDKVVSSDGQNFIDFLNNAFRVGNSNTHLDFNTQKDGKLRLKGTLVQSESGVEQPIGVFRGEYNNTYDYYKGDEVTYQGSTFRYIYNDKTSGNLPTNATYWTVVAAKGNDGQDGSSAPLLYLSASAETMVFNSNNQPSPSSQTITIEAKLQNISGTATFIAIPYIGAAAQSAITLGGSGNVRTLTHTQFGTSADRVVITATLGTLTDMVTIVKLRDGANGQNAIVGYLTNESATLQANAAGVVTNFAGAAGTFKVFNGTTDITSQATFALKSNTGCAASIINTTGTTKGSYSVSAMSADNATAVFMAEYGGVVIEKTLTLAKSKAGTNGLDGANGDYFEYRYAKNGSTSVPPLLTDTSEMPSCWSTSMPSMGTLEYLWMTIAKKSAAGALLQNWSTPIRTTSTVNGTTAPALNRRGDYSSSTTYSGSSSGVDAVRHNGIWYIARVDAGSFSGVIPTSTAKWNSFGASFESLATDLLLAENANIANFIFSDQVLRSQQATNGIAHIILDGQTGYASFGGGKTEFNPNGSGQLAGGKLWWDTLGDLVFGGDTDDESIKISTDKILELEEIHNKEKYEIDNTMVSKSINYYNPAENDGSNSIRVDYEKEFTLKNNGYLTLYVVTEASGGSDLAGFGSDGGIVLERKNENGSFVSILNGIPSDTEQNKIYLNVENEPLGRGVYRISASMQCGFSFSNGENSILSAGIRVIQ